MLLNPMETEVYLDIKGAAFYEAFTSLPPAWLFSSQAVSSGLSFPSFILNFGF